MNTTIKSELENVINQVEETPITAIKEAVEEAVQETKEILNEEKPKEVKLKKKSLPKKPKAKKEEEKPISKKEKAIKDTVKAQKTSIKEKVVSEREVKWIYPADCVESNDRKSFRQKNRNKLHKLERELHRIEDQNSKEYKKKLKELNDFQKTVLKPGQTA